MPVKQTTEQRAKQMHQDGESETFICNKLGISKSTLADYLKERLQGEEELFDYRVHGDPYFNTAKQYAAVEADGRKRYETI